MLKIKFTRDTHLMQQFIYYYKQPYMFRASICPSSGVLGRIRIILLHMVSSTIIFMCVIPVVCVTNKKGGVIKQHN